MKFSIPHTMMICFTLLVLAFMTFLTLAKRDEDQGCYDTILGDSSRESACPHTSHKLSLESDYGGKGVMGEEFQHKIKICRCQDSKGIK